MGESYRVHGQAVLPPHRPPAVQYGGGLGGGPQRLHRLARGEELLRHLRLQVGGDPRLGRPQGAAA